MRRAALAATVICAVHAGCGGDGEGTGGGIPKGMPGGHDRPHAPEHTVAEVRARNGEKLRRASGVVYDSRHGLVLTSNHAVEAAEAIDARRSRQARRPRLVC